MFAIKDSDTGQYYTGKRGWGKRSDAKWMTKASARATIGGLRNSPTLRAQTLRVVSIND